jgi:hypothetical protein
MLSQIITAAVDGFALADRASDRRRFLDDERRHAHQRAS